MLKLLKWLLATVVVLVLIVVIAITLLVDEEKIKSQIQTLAKQQTGGTLTIAGDMNWSFYPELSIALHEVSFSTPNDTAPLASLKTLELAVELMPLFTSQVNVSGINIDGMNLHLVVNKDGTQNWELAKTPEAKTSPAATVTSEQAPAPTNNPAAPSQSAGNDLAIAIETINISHSNISYTDLTADTSAQLSDFSLQSSNANTDGKAFPLEMAFSLDVKNPNAKVIASMKGEAAINTSAKTFSFEQLELDADISADTADGNVKVISTLQGDVSANANTKVLTFERLALSADINADTPEGNIKVTTNINGNIFTDGAAEVFSVKKLTLDATVTGDSIPGKTLPISFNGDVHGDNKAGQFNLKQYQLKLAELDISGDLNATKIGEKLSASGPISIKEFNLKKLLTSLGQTPPQTANKSALSKISLNGQLDYQDNKALLKNLTANLDKSKITGFMGLSNIEKQFATATLNIDSINLDDYMPPKTTENTSVASSTSTNNKNASPAKKPAGKTSSTVAEQPLPLDSLKTINALLKLTIGKFVINELDASNLQLHSRVNMGLVDLKNLSVDLYDGNIKTNGVLDARSTPATLKAKATITGVQMKPLLSAASEIDWLGGSTNLTANITTKGNTVEAWQRSLNGTANFNMTNLVAEGMSIDKQLCQGIALINGKQLNNQWSEDTKLDNLNGKIRFINGTMQNDSLTGGSSTLKLKGNGWLSPEKNKMNYKLGVQVAGDQISNDPACTVNDRYRDISWPLECKGKLDAKPKDLCGIDESKMKDIAQDLATEELKRKANNKIDDYLKEKNLEGVGDLLKGLFN